MVDEAPARIVAGAGIYRGECGAVVVGRAMGGTGMTDERLADFEKWIKRKHWVSPQEAGELCVELRDARISKQCWRQRAERAEAELAARRVPKVGETVEVRIVDEWERLEVLHTSRDVQVKDATGSIFWRGEPNWRFPAPQEAPSPTGGSPSTTEAPANAPCAPERQRGASQRVPSVGVTVLYREGTGNGYPVVPAIVIRPKGELLDLYAIGAQYSERHYSVPHGVGIGQWCWPEELEVANG
jgi:hypothetical protein